jgi:hypothetical protein
MIEALLSPAPVGYLALIRSNRKFRYLWFGQLVSNLGDGISLLVSAVGATLVGKAIDTRLGLSGVTWIIAGATLIPAAYGAYGCYPPAKISFRVQTQPPYKKSHD